MKYLSLFLFFFLVIAGLKAQHNNPNYDAALAEELGADDYGKGFLGFELFQWYGSAALGTYLEVSDKIWKINP